MVTSANITKTDSVIKHSANNKFYSALTQFQTTTRGYVSFSFDYGAVPYVINSRSPIGLFRTEGNVGIDVYGIPLSASFYYNSLKNVSGLNNYFRVSFDAQRYKDLRNRKIDLSLHKLKEDEKLLLLQKQNLLKKQLFLQHQKESFNLSDSLFVDGIIPNGTLISIPGEIGTDTIDFGGFNPTSAREYFKTLYTARLDGINHQLKEIEDSRNAIKQQISELEYLISLDNYSVPGMTKMQQFTSGIQKFEIGMCYPSYNTIAFSGIAMKGINMEWTKGSLFFSISHGNTINNLLATPNLVNQNINFTRNLYNFFDFPNLSNGRRISAVRFGWGAKQKTHLHVGYLYGMGMQSYLGPESGDIEKNHVLDFDAALISKRGITLEALYGRSQVIPVSDENANNETNSTQAFFNTGRSNAGSLRSKLPMQKIGADFMGHIRIIQPFFKSFGVGFILSDHFRMEYKIEKRFAKNWSAGLMYRRDQDNLSELLNYQNIITSCGFTLKGRTGKKSTIRVNIQPLIHTMNYFPDGSQLNNRNIILNGVYSFISTTNKLKTSIIITSNYYNVATATGNFKYSGLMANAGFVTKKFENRMMASAYFSPVLDTLSLGNYFLATDELSIKTGKKMRVNGGVKISQSELFDFQIGGLFRVNYTFNKLISAEFSGESVMKGDFYNYYSPQVISGFPFYCYSKISIHW